MKRYCSAKMRGTMALERGPRWEAEPRQHVVKRSAGQEVGVDQGSMGMATDGAGAGHRMSPGFDTRSFRFETADRQIMVGAGAVALALAVMLATWKPHPRVPRCP
ncbi:hypothetical protein [Methylobacterium cerastii]|uniref:hypothetical protein n=1 Tax=Methylobacterium cerastii TaxID=932741 RepID=UPI001EE15DA8|nr:hypothetical protein [Methylobacterium cerastii]